MYYSSVMTDTERMTPPEIQAMREELQEAEASSSDQNSLESANAFTMDEIQYLGEMPLTDRFEPSHRPPPGANRNILHAAAIFDPNFSPTPTYYQLPPRSRRCYGEIGPSNYGLGNQKTHRRNDSGYESGVPLFIGDDDEDDDGIDAWCDAVLAQGPLVEPNQHILRPDAPSFRPGVHVVSGSRVEETRKPFGKAILVQDEGRHPVADGFPDNGPRVYSSSIVESGDEQDYIRQGRFALVLDYEGITSRLGGGIRDTRSEGAESDADEETYDDQFEEGSRTRWSV